MNTRPPVNDPVTASAYLRRLPGMTAPIIRRTIIRLATFTRQQGLALAGVHYERRSGERLATWAGLILECRREGVTNVVVPGPGHFHHDALIADFMREELAEKIGGTVWYANGPATRTPSPRLAAARRAH